MYPHAEQALQDRVGYIYGSGVHGDVTEFGCFQGRTAEVLAAASSSMLNELWLYHQVNDKGRHDGSSATHRIATKRPPG